MAGGDGLRIGTRASALARWQAEHVAALLRAIPDAPEPELVLIKTEGDRIQDVPLSQVQGSAFFTKEIEEALLQNRVDVAVHSLKDLATEMPPGLELGAVLQREDPRDVLIARGPVTLEDLPQGARVGTSSLRRRAFLSAWRPDLTLLELRGNVPTRIEKLEDGRYEAIVLAAAGVKRLGLEERISSYLPFERFLPAVSQGAIGVQIRAGDQETAAWIGSLDHGPTRMTTTAERAFLRTVEGGCHAPVGAFGTLNGETLHLRGMVSALDGSQSVSGEISGPAKGAHSLGVKLARDILSRGGEEILARLGRAGSGD